MHIDNFKYELNSCTPPTGQSVVDILSESHDVLNNVSIIPPQPLLHNEYEPQNAHGQSVSSYNRCNGTGSEAYIGSQTGSRQCLGAVGVQHGQDSNLRQMQNYCQNDFQNDPNGMMAMLMNMLTGMDNKLQSIEGQLNHQSQRWKSIESQITGQNKRMDSIEQQIVQINNIKQAVSNTQSEVFKLSTDMSTMKTKIDDYDNSIQKYSDMCDDIVSSYSVRESELDHVMDKLISIQIQQNQMQEKQNQMQEKIVEVQWRGMRENLIFTGISEKNLPNGEFENVELTLKNFLRDEMNITQDIQFDRVHRVGKFDRNHSFPRPIIAKFEKFKDKEMVRLSAPKTLVGKHYGVNEQYPFEIESKRKKLYPIAKQA